MVGISQFHEKAYFAFIYYAFEISSPLWASTDQLPKKQYLQELKFILGKSYNLHYKYLSEICKSPKEKVLTNQKSKCSESYWILTSTRAPVRE